MPKQYVKLRVGLLDHLPEFARHPDAFLVYSWCLLKAPMSGPDAGCVRVNQTQLGDEWEWPKYRLSRALKWLQQHPSPEHPLLVLVEKGARNRPGRYAIPRFELSENQSRFGSSGATNPNRFVADSVRLVQRNGGFVADSGQLVQRNSIKERARQKDQEFLRTKRGSNDVYDQKPWLTVRTEAEAREALLMQRGYQLVPEHMREAAVDNAMRNLEFYRIRYAPDEEVERRCSI